MRKLKNIFGGVSRILFVILNQQLKSSKKMERSLQRFIVRLLFIQISQYHPLEKSKIKVDDDFGKDGTSCWSPNNDVNMNSQTE
jgi:hypothetical protein